MPTDDGLIDRADTLMRRYRSFVARPTPTPAPAPVDEPVATEDDLPTLTEIVATDGATSAASSADPAAQSLLVAAIQESLNRWLDETLPELLEKLENGTRQKL